jgi:uncharacterized protein (TIGR00297 family)
MIVRALAGFLLASAIAIAGRFARSLSTGGAVAAVVVGTAAAMAGWDWAGILILFFVTSSALSRFRRAAREARISSIVEKSDERDAWQVLANGGVFATAAIFAVSTPNVDWSWGVLAFGALAAATSDTWATEIGTLAGRPPRSIVSLKALPAGTSGGVTLPGVAASLAGAALIALAAYVAGAVNNPGPVLAGGIAGSLADSLVGATIQERRWCDGCSQSTERRVHTCGRTTRVVGGVPGARNDFVNVVCTIVGGIVAVLVAGLGAG